MKIPPPLPRPPSPPLILAVGSTSKQQVLELPFDSAKKWSLSIHKMAHENGGLTLFIKGAPERYTRT